MCHHDFKKLHSILLRRNNSLKEEYFTHEDAQKL
jgi:hypothetical protein